MLFRSKFDVALLHTQCRRQVHVSSPQCPLPLLHLKGSHQVSTRAFGSPWTVHLRLLPSSVTTITCGTKSGFSTFLSGSTKALISKSCIISHHHPLHLWNTAEQRVTSQHVILATCIRCSLLMGSWRHRHTLAPPTLPRIACLTVTTIKQAAAMTAASHACLEQMTRGWMTWIPHKGMVVRLPGTGSSGLMGILHTWVRFFSLTIRYTC